MATGLFCGTALPAFAQGEALSAQELRRMIERQEQTIASQAEALRAQQLAIEEMRRQLGRLESTRPATAPGAPGSPAAPAAAAAAPAPTVTAAPGFVPVAGGKATFKLGGYVQADVMFHPDALAGEPEDFLLPRLIATGSRDGGKDRFRFSARESRLNLDFRVPTDIGTVRAFTEFDFLGEVQANAQSQLNNYDPRLRHAFIEFGPGKGHWTMMMGQNWSALVDASSYLNFYNAVPFAAIFVRQPQVRYTHWFSDSVSAAVSLENPQGDMAGGSGAGVGEQFDSWPDLVAHVRAEQPWGHVQFGGLLRSIEETQPADSQTAWGLALSGLVKTPFTGEKDGVRFQVSAGDGIGRYVSELGAGFDGVATAGGFALNEIVAGYVGYQHHWSGTLRSTLGYSVVDIDGPAGQAATALDGTETWAANLVYQPVPMLDLVLEYAYGSREGVGGADRSQSLYRFTSRFSF